MFQKHFDLVSPLCGDHQDHFALGLLEQVGAVTALSFHKLLFVNGNQRQSLTSHRVDNSNPHLYQDPTCMGATRFLVKLGANLDLAQAK